MALPGGLPVSVSDALNACYSTPTSEANVLFIASNKRLYAIADPRHVGK